MDHTPPSGTVKEGTGDSGLVRKPVELICCAPDQGLSHIQRRILTAICRAVARMEASAAVCFTPRELSIAICNEGDNLRELHQASAAMRDLRAWLNPLDMASPPCSLRVFEEVSCLFEEIRFRLNPEIERLISSGETFAEVDPLIEKKLGGANAVALYELAVLFRRRGEYPIFPSSRWRQLITGSSTKDNERFVTSKIIKLSGSMLEKHAGLRPIVVRPGGRRVDRIGLEFVPMNSLVEGAHSSVELRPSDYPMQAPSDEVLGEVASVGSANGVDAFEHLLDSWNAQFAAPGRTDGIQPRTPAAPACTAQASVDDKGECNVILSTWKSAQAETLRLKGQFQRAETLEREAALRVLQTAVIRYRMRPEEIFGLPAADKGSIDGPSEPCPSLHYWGPATQGADDLPRRLIVEGPR